MKKIEGFKVFAILSICMLLISFIFNLLYSRNNELIYNTISRLSIGFAIVLQVITLVVKKQYKNTSALTSTKDKVIYFLSIISSIILSLVVLIMLILWFGK